MRVIVRNNTDIHLKIEGGNNGVYSLLTILKPNAQYTLSLQENVTYKEFVLIRLPDKKRLEPLLSSDDLQELREVVIQVKDDSVPPEYCWEGISKYETRSVRRSNHTNSTRLSPLSHHSGASSTHNSGGQSSSFGQWLKSFFVKNAS